MITGHTLGSKYVSRDVGEILPQNLPGGNNKIVRDLKQSCNLSPLWLLPVEARAMLPCIAVPC